MERLARLFKPILIVTGVLLVINDIGTLVVGEPPAATKSPLYEVVAVAGLIALALLPLAFTLLYLREADAAGTFGLVAYVLTMVFTALVAGVLWLSAFVVPALATRDPGLFSDNDSSPLLATGFSVTFYGFGLALLLFGIATIRAGVLSRIGAGILIASAILGALPFLPAGSASLGGIALLWFAFAPGRRANAPVT